MGIIIFLKNNEFGRFTCDELSAFKQNDIIVLKDVTEVIMGTSFINSVYQPPRFDYDSVSEMRGVIIDILYDYIYEEDNEICGVHSAVDNIMLHLRRM